MMHNPMLFAAMLSDAIVRQWPQWEGEAGQIGTVEQSPDAEHFHMRHLIEKEIKSHMDTFLGTETLEAAK